MTIRLHLRAVGHYKRAFYPYFSPAHRDIPKNVAQLRNNTEKRISGRVRRSFSELKSFGIHSYLVEVGFGHAYRFLVTCAVNAAPSVTHLHVIVHSEADDFPACGVITKNGRYFRSRGGDRKYESADITRATGHRTSNPVSRMISVSRLQISFLLLTSKLLGGSFYAFFPLFPVPFRGCTGNRHRFVFCPGVS